MDRGAWRAIVHGVTELDTAEQLTLSLLMEILKEKSDTFYHPSHNVHLSVQSSLVVSAGDQFQDPHGSHHPV